MLTCIALQAWNSGVQALTRLPESTLFTFMHLRSVSILDCIRHLPPDLYSLAFEVKHPELKQHKLVLATPYRRQAAEYPLEILHVLKLISTRPSEIHVLELDSGITGVEQLTSDVLASQLTHTLKSLTHLVQLEFSGGLSSSVSSGLAAALPLMTTLESFALLGVQESLPASGTGSVSNIMRSLIPLQSLRSLKVCGHRDNSMESIKGFHAALRRLQSLTSLCLRSCFHWSCSGEPESQATWLQSTGQLGAAIVVLTRLKSLQVIECFAMDFVEPVLEGIRHLPGLTHLNLSRLSHMPPAMVPESANSAFLEELGFQKRLGPMLAMQTGLQSLHLSGAWMWGGDDSLALSLVGLTKLSQLTLTGFYRPCAFWETFGERVQELQNLQTLALQDNGLLIHEARRLLQGLSALPKLECLTSDAEPLAKLCDELRQVTSLTRLELFGSDTSLSNNVQNLQTELREKLGSMSECLQVVRL